MWKITAVYLHFIKKKSMMLNVFLYLNKEEKWKQTTGQDEDENMKIIETYGNYIEKWSNEIRAEQDGF